MKRSKLLTIPRAATRMLLATLLLTMTAQMAGATDKTLSGSESYTAQDGDVLTGSTSGTVTIAGNASITLNNATINGGIVCEGSATITLVGTNSVSGATNMAGIQVGGSGTTLTIKGNGSLTANGGGNSAGIGLSRAWKVDAAGGDIVIEGGNITATGKGMGAGIGTGVSYGDDTNHTATIGNITIKGGTVTAIGGTNQYFPGSGIGKGGAYSYGNIVVGTVTITTNIDLVNASSISESVTYMHNETDVTDNKADYFTINEDGNRRVIVPKDDIDYNVTIAEEITGGTVTADKTTAKAGELVALTVTPASGYALQSLTVKDASDYDVPVSNKKFIMPKGGVTVSATFIQTTAAFDEATGVLTLNGNVVADEVKAYGAIIGDYGAIVKESPVTSVVCEPGTVLPADCSELFLNYTNSITIDLSNADISGVTNMSKMFGSQSLTTIYVNSAWSMENVTSSDQMFYGCNLLRGGNGSRWEDVRHAVWESNGNDLEAAKAKASRSSYAIIDGKGGLPGYLTVKPKQTPSAPTANVITYTGEAQELVTAGDGTMTYSQTGGNDYTADIPKATNAGTYTVHYKVDGSDNWNAVIAQTVEVTIAKADITMTTAPAAIENLAYSGSAQTLISAGVASFGTVLYSLDGTNFSDALPQGTNVGAYTVTYKVEGSDNWNAVEPQTVEVTIAKADNTMTTAPAAIENLAYSGSAQTLISAGVASFGTVLYSLDGTNFSDALPQGTNVGAYTVTYKVEGSDNWNAVDAQSVEVTIAAKETNLGAVTIVQDQNGTTATIDASLEATIEITSDIEVSQVELNRDFTANQPATVMLPFSLGTGQTVSGGSFYKFSGVTKDGDEWKALFTEVATLKANTPYLFMPSATGQMTFNLNGGTVTLNTTTAGEAGSTASNWEFRGTYQKVQWDGSASDPSDLSKTYGFAKGNATIAAGQFVHFAAGAWLKPMRCYLVYNGSTEGGTFQNAPSMTRGAASTEELPQTITVVLLSSSGETTGIGTLDTKTGDITLEGWYTMDGRKLEGKPTKKGLYINNGRKIVIK